MFRKLLALALFLAAQPAQATWYEASSKHFVVYSEQKPEKLRTFADQLERFDKAMRVLWGRDDPPIGPGNRVTVYVVDDIADVGRLSRVRNAAGAYHGRATGPIAIVPRIAGREEAEISAVAILLHEYAHHFMLTNWPDAAYPSWFVEGFAEFLAPTRFEKDGSVVIGYPPQYRAWGIFQDSLPIQRMLAGDTQKLSDGQVQALYGRGWLLTHYLMIEGSRKAQGMAYLKAINAGTPAREAAEQAFKDLPALDRELDRYARGRFEATKIMPASVMPGPIALRQLTPGEQAIMDVRIRSTAGVNSKTAPGVYADARKAAAPFPNDPFVQRALAETAYDAGDFAAAEAAADRAIAADPKLVEAHCYKAMARMAQAHKAKDYSAETWKAIRKTIVTANRIDPEDPEPLMLYFRSFVEANATPTTAAREGLYKAFDLAPQDAGLRFNAGLAQLRDGKAADARETLRPLAYNPHGGGLAERAGKILAAIESGDAAAVLKASEDEDAASEGEGAAAGAARAGSATR
jgi:tetratricopeptide (TPR) repeat protein